MSENIKITHNQIGILTGTINTLVEDVQKDEVDRIHQVFKEDSISTIKENNGKDDISPALKKTINILKSLIIEIEMVNQRTIEEQGSLTESVNNINNSSCLFALPVKRFKPKMTINTSNSEINVNSHIKEIKAMVDQFSTGYMAKKQTVGTSHGTSLQL